MRFSSSIAGIIDLDVEHEAVELGFGKRIGAFLLDRVLRGDDEERVGQLVGFLADRNLAFLHRLQQGGLRFRRGAVDFVGQHDVGEDRPLDEAKLAAALLVLVEDRRAGDVRRHQVGRELDALEADVENLAIDDTMSVLARPGTPTSRAVAAREDGGQDLFDDFGLADDDAAQLFDHLRARLGELGQIFADAIVRHGGYPSRKRRNGMILTQRAGLRIHAETKSLADESHSMGKLPRRREYRIAELPMA